MKSLIISVFVTSLQKSYGMAYNQFSNKNGIDCMEVDADNGLTLAVMAWIFSTWNHEKAERETIGF